MASKETIDKPLSRTARLARRWFAPDNPWPWLAYLAFYFFPWFFGAPPSQEDLLLTALGFAVFLPTYFYSFRCQGNRLLACIAIETAVGIFLSQVTLTSSVFLIYAAAASGNVRPMSKAVLAMLGILVAVGIHALFYETHIFFWGPAVLFGSMTALSVYMSRELFDSNSELAASQEEGRRLAALAERERIARDLHDLLGHTLTVIAVKSELAGKLVEQEPHKAKQEIRDINQTTRQALADIRGAINGLKNASLSTELASARSALASADISTNIARLEDELPVDIGAVLAMLVREGVTNVIRHSQAENCRIHVTTDAGSARLVIEDDGDGVSREEGNGITGMRARVSALKGTFEISGPPGTKIVANIPLPT